MLRRFLLLGGSILCASMACTSFKADSTAESPGDGGPPSDASTAPSDGASGDAGAESGTADGGCNGKLDCERTVFITKEAFLGNLGGLAGADDHCNAAAAASALPSVRGRQYRAFLSDSTTAVLGRMPHGESAYKTPDGHVVQQAWTALLAGPLLTQINLAEDGNPPSTLNVWTGTSPDGSAAAANCVDWRAPASDMQAGGAVGAAGATSLNWILTGMQLCTQPAHLYCFEF